MFPIAELHCIVTMIENSRICEKIYTWRSKKNKCPRLKFKKLIKKIMSEMRPLGAFILNWTDDSINILENYGYVNYETNNEIYKEIYNVAVYKFKTRHRLVDNLYFYDNIYEPNYDLNTYHHLDFYVTNNNKLINTNIYSSGFSSLQ